MNAAEFLAGIETGKLRIHCELGRDGRAMIGFPISQVRNDCIRCVKNTPPVLSLNGRVVTIGSACGPDVAIEFDTPDDASSIFGVLEKRILYEFEHAWDIRTRQQVDETLSRGNLIVVAENLDVAVQIHREGLTELRRPFTFDEDDPMRELANIVFYKIDEQDEVPQIGDVLTLPREKRNC